jgi:predicted DsbA family dithiol-disulfide isomerase
LAEPAVHDLKRLAPDVEIVWRAFELRPEPVPTLDPRGEYLTRVWREAVYPMAEHLGIQMRLPPVQPRSRRAHEAAQWARRQGRFEDYNAAVFRAFFERGEDIGNVGVLARLASDLQLDESALRSALERREFESDVLADEQEAARLGVTGVPAFIADRRAMLFGVQPVATLQEMVARVSATTAAQTSTPLSHLPLRITRQQTEE